MRSSREAVSKCYHQRPIAMDSTDLECNDAFAINASLWLTRVMIWFAPPCLNSSLWPILCLLLPGYVCSNEKCDAIFYSWTELQKHNFVCTGSILWNRFKQITYNTLGLLTGSPLEEKMEFVFKDVKASPVKNFYFRIIFLFSNYIFIFELF